MKRKRVVVFGLRSLLAEGGIETHARELYPRLAGLGLEVLVLTRHRHDEARRGAPCPGLRTRRLPALPGRGVEAATHSVLAAIYCLITRPDVVHIHGIGPGMTTGMLRAAGLRVVLTHHGHDYDAAKWGSFARAFLKWSERHATRSASTVITVSSALRDDLRLAYGVDARVIRNGVPRRRSAAVAAGPPRLPYVLVVGRLTAHKRVLDAVAAVRRDDLRGVQLLVCGDTSGRDPYVRKVVEAAQHDARVHLMGHVGTEELDALYRGAECLVQPSEYEGLPLAVLEAIGAGCPVVLSAIPAHHELGLPPEQYFPVGDVAAFGRCVAAIRRRPPGWVARAQSEAVAASRFEWDDIALDTARELTGAAAPVASGPGRKWVSGRADAAVAE